MYGNYWHARDQRIRSVSVLLINTFLQRIVTDSRGIRYVCDIICYGRVRVGSTLTLGNRNPTRPVTLFYLIVVFFLFEITINAHLYLWYVVGNTNGQRGIICHTRRFNAIIQNLIFEIILVKLLNFLFVLLT
jgi:hypothetical protein